MSSFTLTEISLPTSPEVSKFFTACLKPSAEEISFYISILYSLLFSMNKHRSTQLVSDLYTKLNEKMSLSGDYYNTLNSYLSGFMNCDEEVALNYLMGLAKNQETIVQLGFTFYYLIKSLMGAESASFGCISSKCNGFQLETLCENLNITLAIFSRENVRYIKPCSGRIILWTFEEGFLHFILIPSLKLASSSFPFKYPESSESLNQELFSFIILPLKGLQKFTNEISFNHPSLSNYLTLITSVLESFDKKDSRVHLSFFCEKVLEMVKYFEPNYSANQYLKYMVDYFYYVKGSGEVGNVYDLLSNNKIILFCLAEGFRSLGEKVKKPNERENLLFSYLLEKFSCMFNITFIIYENDIKHNYVTKITVKEVPVYLRKVQEVYTCLIENREIEFSISQSKSPDFEYSSVSKDKTAERTEEIVISENQASIKHPESQPEINKEKQALNRSVSTQHFNLNFIHGFLSQFLDIKKNVFNKTDLLSIASTLETNDVNISETKLQSMISQNCKSYHDKGKYFILNCFHSACLECLFEQISTTRNKKCFECDYSVSDKEKMKIIMKGFKLYGLDKDISKMAVLEGDMQQSKKCLVCKSEKKMIEFKVLPCISRCLVCVECRGDNKICKVCNKPLWGERSTEYVRCDDCKELKKRNEFQPHCKKCRICVLCALTLRKCVKCESKDVTVIDKKCLVCGEDIIDRKDLVFPFDCNHFYHRRCVRDSCYACRHMPKN